MAEKDTLRIAAVADIHVKKTSQGGMTELFTKVRSRNGDPAPYGGRLRGGGRRGDGLRGRGIGLPYRHDPLCASELGSSTEAGSPPEPATIPRVCWSFSRP